MAMINNASAVLFDLCTRLKDNGVVAKASGNYEFSEDNISLDFVEGISELDFSEHDKKFNDEIRQLNSELSDAQELYDEYYNKCIDLTNQIAELESELEVKDNLLKTKDWSCGNNIELPCDPILVAEKLINATIEYEPTSLQKALFKTEGKCLADKYSNDDLEQIAEHLLVYCKHNKDSEE